MDRQLLGRAAPFARGGRESVRALPAVDRVDRLVEGRAGDAAAAGGAAAASGDPAPLRPADRRRGAQLRARRGGRAYASDTLRTQAIRTLAPHCEHRLFLSATPHNGYDNSFAALLELLDPQRFARGIRPQPRGDARGHGPSAEAGAASNDEGQPRFPRRRVVMLEVEHPDSERAVHATLAAYAAARAQRLASDPSARARGGFRHDAAEEAAVLLAGGVPAHARGAPGDARRGSAARKRRRPPTVLQRAVRGCRQRARWRGERGRCRRGDARGDRRRAAAAEPSRAERRGVGAARRDARVGDGRAARPEDARTTRLLDWVEEHVKPGRAAGPMSG